MLNTQSIVMFHRKAVITTVTMTT